MFVVIVDFDAQGWAHLVTALRFHVQWCKENALVVPADLLGLLGHASKCDRDRQGPTAARLAEVLADHVAMNHALAVTYADAAGLLRCSKRTVERLVHDGVIPTVDVAGTRRIRRADLDAYVAGLPPGPSFRDSIRTKVPA